MPTESRHLTLMKETILNLVAGDGPVPPWETTTMISDAVCQRAPGDGVVDLGMAPAELQELQAAARQLPPLGPFWEPPAAEPPTEAQAKIFDEPPARQLTILRETIINLNALHLPGELPYPTAPTISVSVCVARSCEHPGAYPTHFGFRANAVEALRDAIGRLEPLKTLWK